MRLSINMSLMISGRSSESSRLSRRCGTAVLLLCALPLCAQVRQSPRKDTGHVNAALRLLRSAAALPVEYRADIQLSVIESGRVPKKQAEQILEQLYDALSKSDAPYPLRAAVPTADALERELEGALAHFKLDGLSLRTRVIRSMLPLNRGKAVQHLEDLRFTLPKSDCSSPLIPDVTDYYSTIGTLAIQAYEEPRHRERVYAFWLESQVASAGSSVQVGPIADLLTKATVNGGQMEQLVNMYIVFLSRIRATDREMAGIENSGATTESIRRLAARLTQSRISTAPLIEQYRGFLMRSAADTPCGDVTSDWTAIVRRFNLLLKRLDLANGQSGLTVGELRVPATRGQRAQLRVLPSLGRLDELQLKIYRLHKLELRPDGMAAPPDRLAWDALMSEFFSRIDSYDLSEAACQNCAYFEKTKILLTVLDMAGGNDHKEKVAQRVVDLLTTSPLQFDEPVLWVFQLKLLLNFTRSTTDDQGRHIQSLIKQGSAPTMLPSPIASVIREKVKKADNAAMLAYVQAEEVLKPKFFAPYLRP